MSLNAIAEAAVARVLRKMSAQSPAIVQHTFFGATEIHAKHLSIWYFFNKEADLETAKQSGLTDSIDALTRAELAAGGYPREVLSEIFVSFACDEEVQRDWDGNYFQFLR